MNKLFSFCTLIFITCSLNSFAQITTEEFYAKKDSLTNRRIELTFTVESLKLEIDSLQKIIPALQQELITQYRELYVLKYGKKIGERISNKRIWKGMSDEMVRDGWGEPDFIEKNVEKWGVFTQWHYGDIIFFFRDGKLTDWEEGNSD